MTYIVTSKRRSRTNAIPGTGRPMEILSRVAVATLEEAQSVANAEANQHGASAADYRTIFNSEVSSTLGSSIRLSDGTVIEIEEQ